MDRGQGFPGGSGPPGGNRRGSGLPNNMFSPDLGGVSVFIFHSDLYSVVFVGIGGNCMIGGLLP